MERWQREQSGTSWSKPMNTFANAAVVISAMLFAPSACRHYYGTGPATNTATSVNHEVPSSAPLKIEGGSSKETKASVTISSVAIYGWWWSDEQLASGFDGDNPPPKKSYIRIDSWDASDTDTPHPDRVDVTCRLENHTNRPIDLSLEAFADFKVASYEAIAKGAATQSAVDEKLKQTQWSELRKLGKVVVVKLLPGEAREVKFKDFHLRAVIDRYLAPSAGDLWPWKLRVSLVAQNSKGVRVANAEAIIDLVPAD